MNRRRLLQALGLGALSSVFHRASIARAAAPAFPSRIVFYVQPHGHIPNAWNMAIPGGPVDQVAERSLLDLQVTDLSPTLQPLYAFRDRLLAIEGLSHTSALADIAAVAAARPCSSPCARRCSTSWAASTISSRRSSGSRGNRSSNSTEPSSASSS